MWEQGDKSDHFYTVLAQLYNETSAWEESAPAGEHITPKRVAQLWDAALAVDAGEGAEERCASEEPELRELAPGHLVRCHLAEAGA